MVFGRKQQAKQHGVHAGKNGPAKVFGKVNLDWEPSAARNDSGISRADLDFRGDFEYSTEKRSVSVFDGDAFTDVLVDRYGDDPREVDKERIQLESAYLKVSHDLEVNTSKLNKAKKAYNNNPTMMGTKSRLDQITKERKSLEKDAHNAKEKLDEFNEDNPAEWTQYYLVSGGHLHNSESCGSLHVNTKIYPYPEASGLNDDEAVELGGHRICTKCVPNAPVDIADRPSHVWTEEERKEAQWREKQDAEKAEKEKLAKEKAEKKRAQDAIKIAQGKKFKEPIDIAPLSAQLGYFTDQGKKIKTVSKLKSTIKDSVLELAQYDIMVDMDGDFVHKDSQGMSDNAVYFVDKFVGDDEDKESYKDTIMKASGSEDSWLVNNALGSPEKARQSYEDFHNAVQIVANVDKGGDFDKALNSLFNNKRIIAKYTKEMSRFMQGKEMDYDTYDFMSIRIDKIKSFIKYPDAAENIVARYSN